MQEGRLGGRPFVWRTTILASPHPPKCTYVTSSCREFRGFISCCTMGAKRSDGVGLLAEIGDDAPVLHFAGALRAVADFAFVPVTLGPHPLCVHAL